MNTVYGFIYVHIYVYIYICAYICIYICIYVYSLGCSLLALCSDFIHSMKRSGVKPDDVAEKHGVSRQLVWEWHSKGTRLVMLCSAGRLLVGMRRLAVFMYLV